MKQPAEVHEFSLGDMKPGGQIEIVGAQDARYRLTAPGGVELKDDGRVHGLVLETDPIFNPLLIYPNDVAVSCKIGVGRKFEIYRFENGRWLFGIKASAKKIFILSQ